MQRNICCLEDGARAARRGCFSRFAVESLRVLERVNLQGCGDKNTATTCYLAPMIILSHRTALAYMRFVGSAAVSSMKRIDVRHAFDDLDAPRAAFERFETFAAFKGFDVRCPHLLCSVEKRKKSDERVTFHAVAELPRGSILLIEPDVCMVSPEMLFLQLAYGADVLDAVQLGFELCGIYSYPFQIQRDFSERAPFVSRRAMDRFLESQEGVPGVGAARRAMRYVVEGSASQMETACAMMLGLPYRLGGLNFPKFTINQKIEISKRLQAEMGRTQCFCDLAWFDRGVVFEYDSNAYHVGAERIAADSDRRNALLRMGYKVVTLTGNQMGDAREFMRVA